MMSSNALSNSRVSKDGTTITIMVTKNKILTALDEPDFSVTKVDYETAQFFACESPHQP